MALSHRWPTRAARVGHELEVSAWPEPPSAILAGLSEGVHDGTEAFALGTSERAIYTEAAARIAGLMSGFRSELINQRSRRRVQIVRWMILAILINETHHLFGSRPQGNVAWLG